MSHEFWMRRALELAEGRAGYTLPNPKVGAVLVSENRIIAEGFHQKCGEGHAEVNCLDPLPENFNYDRHILYVTLEPCSHTGKTPPCSELIIQKGIPEVVIATRDPFHKVNGKGIAQLKANGIRVTEGVCGEDARFQNRFFFFAHRQKRSFVTLKYAHSSDGFMDKTRKPEDQGSFAISSPETRSWVHGLRGQFQGIMVGGRTALVDDPKLDVREVSGQSPTPIIVGPHTVLPEEAKLFRNSRTLLFSNLPQRAGFQGTLLPFQDLKSTLKVLYNRGILNVLVEGGPQLATGLLNDQLVQEVYRIQNCNPLGAGLAMPVIPSEMILNDQFPINSQDKCAYYTNKHLHDILNSEHRI